IEHLRPLDAYRAHETSTGWPELPALATWPTDAGWPLLAGLALFAARAGLTATAALRGKPPLVRWRRGRGFLDNADPRAAIERDHVVALVLAVGGKVPGMQRHR